MFPGTLDVPTTSPTSGHLSIILNLIAKTYDKRSSNRTLLLLSNWMQEICIQSENYIGILSKTKECENVIASLIACGATTDHDILIAICSIFEILLSSKNVVWRQEIYSSIVDFAMLHLTSYNKHVREKYSQLLMNVPLNIVIPKLNKECLPSETKVSCFYETKYKNLYIYSNYRKFLFHLSCNFMKNKDKKILHLIISLSIYTFYYTYVLCVFRTCVFF